MMHRQLLSLTVASLLLTGSAAGFTVWNDTRASALLPGDLVIIRTEIAAAPGQTNSVLYLGDGVVETALAAVDDGPNTFEATVPGPVADRRYYGFRRTLDGEIDLLPVRLADGVTPTRANLTQLAVDPVGDEIFGRPNLDLTECRLSRDATRLYAALSNASGGFPVSDGLTFFSYLLGIKDPAVADPETLFAMIHTVDVAGIIEPGLYQINGTGVDDLVKIGEITATELAGENTLILSCELADLESNAIFQSWYDPTDPRIDSAGFAQKVTIFGGAEEADSTPGGIWHLREVALDPMANQVPELSNLLVPDPGPGVYVSVVYEDADGNCPVIAELVLDDSDVYELRPQAVDYSGAVEYRSEPGIPALVAGEWTRAVVRFSDDLVNMVELEETAVGVPLDGMGFSLAAAPNPFSTRTEFAFELPHAAAVELSIYDLAGRRVRTLVDGPRATGRHTLGWDGRDDAGRRQPAGVYFYRLRSTGRDLVKRVMLRR